MNITKKDKTKKGGRQRIIEVDILKKKMKKQNNTRRVCKKNIMIKQVTIKKKNDLNEKKVVQSEKMDFNGTNIQEEEN